MAKFFTEYLVINDEKKVECRKCGHIYCNPEENYKEFALQAEVLPSEVSPVSPRDGEWWCLYREFYCPDCAVLLDVDVVAPGDPIIHDIRLKV